MRQVVHSCSVLIVAGHSQFACARAGCCIYSNGSTCSSKSTRAGVAVATQLWSWVNDVVTAKILPSASKTGLPLLPGWQLEPEINKAGGAKRVVLRDVNKRYPLSSH